MPFQKGNQYGGWNKGLKGIQGPNRTSFKKGQIPANFKGGISYSKRDKRWLITCREGQGSYPYAKAIMSCHLKRLLGPNEIVHHKDTNSTNDVLNNLQLVTRAEHLKMHKVSRWR